MEPNKKNKLPIKTFELSQFITDPAIITISKRGSGMSWVKKLDPNIFIITDDCLVDIKSWEQKESINKKQ